MKENRTCDYPPDSALCLSLDLILSPYFSPSANSGSKHEGPNKEGDCRYEHMPCSIQTGAGRHVFALFSCVLIL
jgi:hypothetical protein